MMTTIGGMRCCAGRNLARPYQGLAARRREPASPLRSPCPVAQELGQQASALQREEARLERKARQRGEYRALQRAEYGSRGARPADCRLPQRDPLRQQAPRKDRTIAQMGVDSSGPISKAG